MSKKQDKQTATSRSAVIYARFSSHNQREESIEQQVAECKVFAEQNNLEIVEVYADAAVSGKTENRTQFQRLKRDAQRRKFSTIIAYKSNRIARNMMNALIFENEMSALNIQVLYAKEEFGNNAAGRFALRTMMNVNQFYSENLAEDIRRGMEDNALKCKSNGSVPFGYKTIDGKYTVYEPEAAVVREIFTRTAAGEAFADIAADLNRRGIKTKAGNEWGRSSFHRMFKNEKYIGVYEFGNIRTEDGIPPIVSKELFYTVNNYLKNKKNPQGKHRENGDYLLTGKLFCGECGSAMVGISGTGRHGEMHYYYTCNGKRLKKEPKCTKANVQRDFIEQAIASAVREYVLQDDVMEWIANSVDDYQKNHKNNSEMSLLQSQLADIQKSVKNLLNAIEQGIITPTTKQRMLELEDEQSKVEAKIVVLKSETIEVSRDHVIGWLESFREGDVSDKDFQRELFKSFLKAAYLYDDGRLKIVFDPISKGGKSDIEIELSSGSAENSELADKEKGSYKLAYAPPKCKQTALLCGLFLYIHAFSTLFSVFRF